MIKTICICDRCRREIPPGEKTGYLAWNIRGKPDGDLTQANPYENNHYCMDCMDKVRNFIAGNSALKEAKAEKPNKLGARRIDYGKIMALRNAGWTAKAIAEEMNMTETAVYQAISKYKKSQREAEEGK